MALFPIGIVVKLTDLSARQIRYYEQNELIFPARTTGNQRLYSFNDVTRLLQIKELLEQGVNLAGIKQVLLTARKPDETAVISKPSSGKTNELGKANELTEQQLHELLKQQLLMHHQPGQVSLIQGELARFFR